MPPEVTKTIQAWLKKAQSDLRYAKVDLEAQPPNPEEVLFHSQQSVEKALKGFLAFHAIAFSKTHDLLKLGKQVEKIVPELGALLLRASDLTPYATTLRYPDIGEEVIFSIDEAKDALKLATEVFDAITAKLPESVRPPKV